MQREYFYENSGSVSGENSGKSADAGAPAAVKGMGKTHGMRVHKIGGGAKHQPEGGPGTSCEGARSGIAELCVVVSNGSKPNTSCISFLLTSGI
jgi:hypothetical protein